MHDSSPINFQHVTAKYCGVTKTALTSQPAVKVGVGGHLEARVGQQETVDVGEAGVDVLPHVLQLFVLVLLHLSSAESELR